MKNKSGQLDRPTPETDALDCELHNPNVLSDRYSTMRDHAGRLERERDEAREALRTLAEHGESEIQRVTKDLDLALEVADELAIQAERLRKGRDEAREALGKICIIATTGYAQASGHRYKLIEISDISRMEDAK